MRTRYTSLVSDTFECPIIWLSWVLWLWSREFATNLSLTKHSSLFILINIGSMVKLEISTLSDPLGLVPPCRNYFILSIQLHTFIRQLLVVPMGCL